MTPWLELSRACAAADVAPTLTELVRHLPPLAPAGVVLLRENRSVGAALVLQVPQPRGDLLAAASTALGLDPSRARAATSFPLAGSEADGPGLPGVARTVAAAGARAWLGLAATAAVDRFPLLLSVYAAHAVGVSERWLEGPGGRAPAALLSLHSHAEAFVHTSRDPERVRARLDAHADQHGDLVSEYVGRGLEAASAATEPTPAGLWAAVVKEHRRPVREAFEEGGLVMRSASSAVARGPLEHSPFHQRVRADAALGAFLESDPGFLTTRVLTSLLYQQTYAAGFELVDRFLACYLVSRELRARSGVDPGTVLGTVTSLCVAPLT